MYRFYRETPFETIYDFFKPVILNEAQRLGIPIILHLPKLITDCMEDTRRLIADFPKLKIIIAHLGGPHMPVPGLKEAYEEISDHGNIFMDTAMIPSEEVVSLAIEKFGVRRIMFGSDEPLNLVRAKVYRNPLLGQRLITEYPYHWVDAEEHERYRHMLDEEIVHMHWAAISALMKAIKKLPLGQTEAAKKSIFFENAKSFFKFDV